MPPPVPDDLSPDAPDALRVRAVQEIHTHAARVRTTITTGRRTLRAQQKKLEQVLAAQIRPADPCGTRPSPAQDHTGHGPADTEQR